MAIPSLSPATSTAFVAVCMLYFCDSNQLRLLALDGSRVEVGVQESHAITSLSISADSRFALLSLSCKAQC